MALQLPTQYVYEIVQYRHVIIAIMLYYWVYFTIVASELKAGGLSYEGPKHTGGLIVSE